ncbi:hypothetical protein AZ27_1468 [Bordetella bronchiseptica D756]|nr:hypothetical protein AZ27_1468 [Bordetella bronchiseptica D756]
MKCHDVSKPCLAVWDCCNRRIWSGRKKSRRIRELRAKFKQQFELVRKSLRELNLGTYCRPSWPRSIAARRRRSVYRFSLQLAERRGAGGAGRGGDGYDGMPVPAETGTRTGRRQSSCGTGTLGKGAGLAGWNRTTN